MLRRSIVGVAVAVLIAGSIGATALAANGGADEYTGCLRPNGRLVAVAEGSLPAGGSCRPSQTIVHLAGSAAVATLQARADALEADVAGLEARTAALEALLAGVSRQFGSLHFPDSIYLPNGSVNAGGNVIAGIDVNAQGNIFGANIGSRGQITATGTILTRDRLGAGCTDFVNEICIAYLP